MKLFSRQIKPKLWNSIQREILCIRVSIALNIKNTHNVNDPFWKKTPYSYLKYF